MVIFLFPSLLLHLLVEELYLLAPLFIQLFIYVTRDSWIHSLFCVLLPLCPLCLLPCISPGFLSQLPALPLCFPLFFSY